MRRILNCNLKCWKLKLVCPLWERWASNIILRLQGSSGNWAKELLFSSEKVRLFFILSRAWDKEKKSRVPTKNRSQTFGFHTRSRKREIFWCFLFFFIVVVVCFSFIIGNLLISYVNVRAIGKECTLTGKELLPGIFVAFVSPKLKYLIS